MRATIRQSESEKLTPEHEEFLDECARADGAAPIGDGPRRALELQAAERRSGKGPGADTGSDAGPNDRTSVFELRTGEGNALAGLAVLGPDGERLTAELAVAPESRRHGHGRRLVDAVLDASEHADPWFWAHGDHPGAARLAETHGLRRARELLQMRMRVSDAQLPEPELPPDVVLRTFRPGADDAEWLRVNNAAFSWHPEQGGQTPADLEAAIGADDFDADGFFVAVRAGDDDRILGFHWTKVHAGDDPLGEVFVLGVDPAVHSRGLGRALTLAGLHHLARTGVREIELYTEGDNDKALGLYSSLGFRRYAIDVSYTRHDDTA